MDLVGWLVGKNNRENITGMFNILKKNIGQEIYGQ